MITLMKVLITGGAGFIGSHVVDAHIKRGDEVVVVDMRPTEEAVNLAQHFSDSEITNSSINSAQATSALVYYQADITDKVAMKEIFEQEKPEVLQLLAAQISVPASVKDPMLDANINVVGTLNCLELAVAHGVRRVVYVSSGGALGGPEETLPSTERIFPDLASPYAISKFACEHYLAFYAREHGLTYVALRYANVYGPRQIPKGESAVIAIFTQNVIAGTPSTLFAYPDMQEGCTRDYVFVGDVVEANLLATERGDNGVFNIGTGVELPMLTIYTTIDAIEGKNVPITITGPRPGDLKRSVIDSTLAGNILGWEAKTSLEDGLRITYEFEKNR